MKLLVQDIPCNLQAQDFHDFLKDRNVMSPRVNKPLNRGFAFINLSFPDLVDSSIARLCKLKMTDSKGYIQYLMLP